eukprot:2189877-Alexandrium_andersonii.AAC.1
MASLCTERPRFAPPKAMKCPPCRAALRGPFGEKHEAVSVLQRRPRARTVAFSTEGLHPAPKGLCRA